MLFILSTSVCVAIDASCVNITNGASNKLNIKNTLITSIAFSVMQVIMLLCGYFLSSLFSENILKVGNYIAFGLLCYLAINMTISIFKKEEVKDLNYKNIFIQAVATSIDASALGISILSLSYSIVTSSICVFIVTLLFCILAFIIGNKFGNKFNNQAKVIGVIVLVLIALKILLIK